MHCRCYALYTIPFWKRLVEIINSMCNVFSELICKHCLRNIYSVTYSMIIFSSKLVWALNKFWLRLYLTFLIFFLQFLKKKFELWDKKLHFPFYYLIIWQKQAFIVNCCDLQWDESVWSVNESFRLLLWTESTDSLAISNSRKICSYSTLNSIWTVPHTKLIIMFLDDLELRKWVMWLSFMILWYSVGAFIVNAWKRKTSTISQNTSVVFRRFRRSPRFCMKWGSINKWIFILGWTFPAWISPLHITILMTIDKCTGPSLL